MRRIYSTDDIIGHTITNSEADFHLILIENKGKFPDYTDRDSLTAQLFHNLKADIEQWAGFRLQLTVLTVREALISRENPYPAISKALNRLKTGFSQQNEGVMVVGKELSVRISAKAYHFLNVILPNVDTPKAEFLRISKPVNDDRSWMISVPSYLWAKIGSSVRGDSSGINLLGFIYRGAKALYNGQTELSIYKNMRNWHKGKYSKIVVINTLKKFNEFMAKLKLATIVSLDAETDNLQRIDNTILSFQFLLANVKPPEIDANFECWFLPVEHPDTPWTRSDLKEIRKQLKAFFERQAHQQTHVYANGKFDLHQLMDWLKLRHYGAAMYDVQAGSYGLEENQILLKSISVRPYALEHMETCAEYVRPSDLVIRKADRARMREFSLEDICMYGVIDVVTPYFLMCEQIRVAEEREYPNFYTFVTHQIGRMIQAMTIMEHNGIAIDMEYLESIASPVGPLADQIREAVKEIEETKEAKKANQLVLKRNPNYQSKGLFGTANMKVWNIRKDEHKRALFFDVCKLEPVSYQSDGETGKLDAKFQKTYRHHPVVKKFTAYQKLSKLKNAFADSIYDFLQNDNDMKIDKRLRMTFVFLDILSGRSATRRPSTQQLPTHGKNAKIIKKQFIARLKRILGKTDFAAHEVRVSGNLSNDKAICATVDLINEKTLEFRIAIGSKEKIDSMFADLESKYDLHVLNYETFFSVKITKKDPRRQDAKVAIFSVTYGAKAPSVANKMREEALVAAEDMLVNSREASKLLSSGLILPPEEIERLKKNALQEEEVEALEKKIRYLKSDKAKDEYLEKATELLAVLEKKWSGLSNHIEDLCAEVRVDHVLFGPHGRPRHLWGHASPDKFAGFAMDRRAFNSKGQGFASDYGFVSIYLFNSVKWKLCDSRGYKTDILTVNAVHDSAMNDMAFQFFPIYTYMQEHAMTTLAEGYYKKHFGIQTPSHYGFDLEAGTDESKLITWNKRPADLPSFVSTLGEMANIPKKELQLVIEDANRIGDLRLEELKSNHRGYNMRLLNEGFWEKTIPKLNCFKG